MSNKKAEEILTSPETGKLMNHYIPAVVALISAFKTVEKVVHINDDNDEGIRDVRRKILTHVFENLMELFAKRIDEFGAQVAKIADEEAAEEQKKPNLSDADADRVLADVMRRMRQGPTS